MEFPTKLDKSKGFMFSVEGIDFYKGLYSSGSCIAEVDGEFLYLSAPLCITHKGNIKELASKEIKRKRAETLYYRTSFDRPQADGK